MDHHCPWLNGCIGFQNRKYFLMLLWYSWFTMICAVVSSIPRLFSLFQEILALESYTVGKGFILIGSDNLGVLWSTPWNTIYRVFCGFLYLCGSHVHLPEIPFYSGLDKFDNYRVFGISKASNKHSCWESRILINKVWPWTLLQLDKCIRKQLHPLVLPPSI